MKVEKKDKNVFSYFVLNHTRTYAGRNRKQFGRSEKRRGYLDPDPWDGQQLGRKGNWVGPMC